MKHLWILLFFCSCVQNAVEKESIAKATSDKEIKYEAKVFKNNDGTFGYDVFQNSELVIKQKTIPTKSGLSGFLDSNKAARVAELALKKMNTGEFPPTIQETEIDSILK